MIRNGVVICVITILSLSVSAKALKSCSETSSPYNKTGLDLYNTIKKVLTSTLENKTLNPTVDFDKKLTEASNMFLEAAEKCPGNKENKTLSHTIYISLIKFITKDAAFLQDLHKKGEFKCFDKKKTAILSQCFNNTDISTRSPHLMLYKSSILNFNLVSCDKTELHKECINTILEKECALIATFINNLFEFLHQNCTDALSVIANNVGVNQTSGCPEKTTAAWATFAVVILEWAKLH